MIGVLLQGRLGNQLFQYAFAYSTAKKLKTEYFIDLSHEKFLIPSYFTLEPSLTNFLSRYIFNITGFNNIFSFHLRRFFSKVMRPASLQKEVSFGFDVYAHKVLESLKNDIHHNGYFQSEIYFQEYQQEIRKLFTIRRTVQKTYEQTYKSIFSGKKIATFHIRRTDYTQLEQLNLGKPDLSLPRDYYHNIISKLEKDNLLFVFISDDPKFVAEEFSYVKNKHISQANEITDFQHMLNADICVISNSTFSWWAAWLNTNPKKMVYCPKYFLGFHIQKTVPPEIYPSNWILMDTH